MIHEGLHKGAAPGGTAPKVNYVRMENVDTWHDTLCATFSRTEYMPGEASAFRGELSSVKHGDARMSRIQASAGWFSRKPSVIRSDRFDGFMILLSLRGDLRLSQGDRRLQARHGEALVYRHGTPFELEIPYNYLAVSLWVTPEVMEAHCPAIARNAPVALTGDTVNGRLALAMVQELCASAVTREIGGVPQLVGATLDVISTTALRPEVPELRRNLALIEKLSDYVSRNIDDTELNLDRLVEASGVSARTLNRTFAEDGTTPMRWVWDRRLRMAHDALSHQRVRNVTEAAFSFGFKDVSHFSRAFSRKFGTTPRTLLLRN
ncbi:helix-turn-helix domain-containing protein [Salipiger sp. P9]|uniref:helix-turn-helix domain-containing protein n=1 Tax=Salipiger pentaromativorans TaxID=2943193 RepID=UPI0021584466|nr:helix-turn-helix domain-containing protein [Salipiger pentaromativorans]MCR8550610.1 helix-turn-helix domain-containing protein [Salipiger pentaromativorans]